MKFQTLALLGLVTLTTVTAQSARAQVPNQTHLTSNDVAAIAESRSRESRPPAPSATQAINLTPLTSDQVSTVQVSDTPKLNAANDRAVQLENSGGPIVDAVVNRQANNIAHPLNMVFSQTYGPQGTSDDVAAFGVKTLFNP
ncbi:hypothetical protein H6F51_00220 [Cyanobacteria bacterium FACHB-DQ100]|nr:hypothetical protein [Cyanobacteria bacterium FACHB-DQ100]